MKKGTLTVRIGLDDTDHPDFGCTTYSFDGLMSSLSEMRGLKIIERRLVRLWPYASRRTRGNGALSAVIEIPSNSKENLLVNCKSWFDGLLSEIADYPVAENKPSPALLVSFDATPSDGYWEAVRGEVNLDKRVKQVIDSDIFMLSHEDKWGVIGASAAISWVPKGNHSWELIGWREDEKIGTERRISKKSILEMSSLFTDTFMNRDPTFDKGIISPRTPCPVLYGIRGATKSAVESAHSWIQGVEGNERCFKWASHITNQLSDDHLQGTCCGTVISKPEVKKGAHAIVKVISDHKGENLVAFSEGGNVNKLLRQLMPGDRISWMGLRSPDGSIHLERLKLTSASPRNLSRPECCGSSMRSKGRGQELYCDRCKMKADKYWIFDQWSPSGLDLVEGWSQPSPSNRRHLSLPLEHGIPM